MKYLSHTITKNIGAIALEPAPYGPGFNKRQLKLATKMDVYAWPVGQPGDNDCEFVLKGAGDIEIGRVTVKNYVVRSCCGA